MNSNFKILLVDDDPSALQLLETYIEKTPYSVHCVDNVADALEFIEQWSHSLLLVISDYNLENEETGFMIRKEMLQSHAQIPFVVISAMMNGELVTDGIGLEVCAFVDKPIKKEFLLELVEEKIEDRLKQLKDDQEFSKASGFF